MEGLGGLLLMCDKNANLLDQISKHVLDTGLFIAKIREIKDGFISKLEFKTFSSHFLKPKDIEYLKKDVNAKIAGMQKSLAGIQSADRALGSLEQDIEELRRQIDDMCTKD